MDNAVFLSTCAGLTLTMLLAWVIITGMLYHNAGERNRIVLGFTKSTTLLMVLLVMMPAISVGILFFTLMPLAGVAPTLPPVIVASFIIVQAIYYACLLVANGWQIVKYRQGDQKEQKK